MVKGPDFQSQFFAAFGEAPRKIVYETRGDSNGPHDIVFLASLIHEARLRPRDIKLPGDRTSIPIERDCWELGIDEGFYTTPARLTLKGVKSPVMEFQFRHPVRLEGRTLDHRPRSVLQIDRFALDPALRLRLVASHGGGSLRLVRQTS